MKVSPKLEEHSWKIEIEIFPVVRYSTWKLELVSDILWVIVGTMFQLKVTTLTFWTKFAKKGASMGKVNIAIEFCIFELVYNHSQNIWDYLYTPCDIAHYRKGLISVFGERFATINKIFILGQRLGTRLPFYGV